jgi:hypothetical protein
VPLLVGGTLAAIPFVGWPAVLVAVIVYNVLRLRLTLWGLDLGLAHGTGVGAALRNSALPRLADDAQRAAAFAIGLALPVGGGWLLESLPSVGRLPILLAAGVGAVLMLAPATRTRVTGIRYGLACLGLALLLLGGLR